MAESECCDDYDDLSECDEIGDLQEGVDIINSLPLSEDDDEPYCICLEPNNQHMIACDGEKCEIQWYHFTCVGVDPMAIPKGKWYCKECMTARKKTGIVCCYKVVLLHHETKMCACVKCKKNSMHGRLRVICERNLSWLCYNLNF